MDSKQEALQQRALIREARRALVGREVFDKRRGTCTHTAGAIEVNGSKYLEMRRLLGLPDPDGKAWGDRMMRYHMGTLALLQASRQPGFTVDDVPHTLRRWLTHPIWDRPATNRDLEAIITTYTEAAS